MPPVSPSQRNAGRPRRKSSGGLGPLFFIMGAIVLAVIVTGVIIANNQSDDPTPKPTGEPQITYQSVTVKTKWPKAEPWHGLEVGMTRDQVISMFGKPNIEESNFALGHERLEFHDDPSRAGLFGGTGGSMLTVFIDTKTNKVLYFIPPGGVVKTIR